MPNMWSGFLGLVGWDWDWDWGSGSGSGSGFVSRVLGWGVRGSGRVSRRSLDVRDAKSLPSIPDMGMWGLDRVSICALGSWFSESLGSNIMDSWQIEMVLKVGKDASEDSIWMTRDARMRES